MWECPPSPAGHVSEAHFSKVSHVLDPQGLVSSCRQRLGPLEIEMAFYGGGWHPTFSGGSHTGFPIQGGFEPLSRDPKGWSASGDREADSPHQTPPLCLDLPGWLQGLQSLEQGQGLGETAGWHGDSCPQHGAMGLQKESEASQDWGRREAK